MHATEGDEAQLLHMHMHLHLHMLHARNQPGAFMINTYFDCHDDEQ